MTFDAIVGDWGTTRLRLFKTRAGKVVDRLDGPGIGQLTGPPSSALASSLATWREDVLSTGLFLCGMAGSRNGLVEAPYAPCPVDRRNWSRSTARTSIDDVNIHIAAGLSGRNFTGRADVMRGEETQIFGAIALDPSLGLGRQLFLLPGTHSKWVELNDGRIERFHTFPTGELFALLRDHSTLARAGSDASGHDEGFRDGLARASAGTLASLFESRAAQLIEGRSQGWALGLLSGILIGCEVREAIELVSMAGARITVVGASALATLYRQALAAHDLSCAEWDGDECAIAGLLAIRADVLENEA